MCNSFRLTKLTNNIARGFVFKQMLLAVVLAIFTTSSWAEQSSNDYLLGVGDTIHITVYNEDDLTMKFRIGKSGTINFPFLNEINVLDLTTNELADTISAGLQDDYLIHPQVNINVIVYRPFFINGEVKKPGGYPYQIGLTFDKAIALAGGLTERASHKNWTILRKQNGQRIEIQAKINSELLPDDIITIEKSFF